MTSTPPAQRAANLIKFSLDPINALMIEAIADKIMDIADSDLDTDDPLEGFDIIASHSDLPEAMRDSILLCADLCPMHRCDIDICADDADQECADLRAALDQWDADQHS